jgi:hypothetical protein
MVSGHCPVSALTGRQRWPNTWKPASIQRRIARHRIADGLPSERLLRFYLTLLNGKFIIRSSRTQDREG